MIIFPCDNCGNVLKAMPFTAGTMAMCPVCRLTTRVPRLKSPERTTQPELGPKLTPRWVRPGERVSIAGFEIECGLFYFGSDLPSPSQRGLVEPSLIDPSLAAFPRSPQDREDAWYMPIGYGRLKPFLRYDYLRWLADGRPARTATPRHLDLLVMGMERRALHEASISEVAKADVPAIREEVMRLVAQIRRSNEFASTSVGRLLEYLDLRYTTRLPKIEWLLDNSDAWEPWIRYRLGQCGAKLEPISAELAFGWAAMSIRTGHYMFERCGMTVAELFIRNYADSLPDGWVIKPGKTMAPPPYRPVNLLLGTEWIAADTLPDLTSLRSRTNAVVRLLQSCFNDLDPVSRWISRSGPISPPLGYLAARSITTLQTTLGRKLLSEWAAELEQATAGADRAIVPGDRLHARWVGSRQSAMLPDELRAMAAALQTIGFGVEPDARYRGRNWKGSFPCAVFRLPVDAGEPSPAYWAAGVALQLAVNLGKTLPAFVPLLQLRAVEAAVTELDAAERARLQALGLWLQHERLAGPLVREVIDSLPPERREAIAVALATAAAGACGITAATLKPLEKVYATLGVPTEQLHRDLHAGATATAPPPGNVRLDRREVQARLHASQNAAALLHDLFADDEPAPVLTDGLDAAHNGLLRDLAGRDSLTRGEWDALAAAHGLLPDGAYDRLNEAAQEACEEPLFEGDDPLTIAEDVLAELLG